MSGAPFRLELAPSPDEIAARASLRRESSDDPYRIDGPACIGFSGGATSGYLLAQHLKRYGGTLPRDVFVIFADTGKEHPQTHVFIRECSERWGVDIIGVRAPTPEGELIPFEALIRRKKATPNVGTAWCSYFLKVAPTIAFMRRQGYDQWTNIVGLRADEQRRLADKRAEVNDHFTNAFPLAAACVTKPHILRWWEDQPFKLRVPAGLGNCDACWKKKYALRLRIERDYPGTLAWWARMERESGHTFKKRRETPTYEAIINFARSQGNLPLDEDECESGVCSTCTD